jgi:hypothetical protein
VFLLNYNTNIDFILKVILWVINKSLTYLRGLEIAELKEEELPMI